jgi:6,7-dimethyl-8-ribityllumazine synthase
MDLAVMGGATLGFGIITCENSKQAWARASADKKNVGGSSAKACLRMNDVKKKYPYNPK